MSNNQWSDPNGRLQQGYPQQPSFGSPQSQPGYSQPQPGYQQPQPGYSQPQPGYSQPQPGYQQSQPGYSQPQPGYQQSQPGYPQSGYGQQGYQPAYGSTGQGMPPKRGNTVLIVALAAVLVAIAGFAAWWLLGRNNQPNTTPSTSTQTATQTTQKSEEPSPSPTRKTTRPTTRTSSETPKTTPEMPTSFGDFTQSTTTGERGTREYSNSAKDSFRAAYDEGSTVADFTYLIKNVKSEGKWSCGEAKTGTMCLTDTYSGVLGTLMPKNKSTSEVAKVSDAFLEAWK